MCGAPGQAECYLTTPSAFPRACGDGSDEAISVALSSRERGWLPRGSRATGAGSLFPACAGLAPPPTAPNLAPPFPACVGLSPCRRRGGRIHVSFPRMGGVSLQTSPPLCWRVSPAWGCVGPAAIAARGHLFPACTGVAPPSAQSLPRSTFPRMCGVVSRATGSFDLRTAFPRMGGGVSFCGPEEVPATAVLSSRVRGWLVLAPVT